MPAVKNSTGIMKSLFKGIFLGCSADMPLFIKKSNISHTHTGVFKNIAITM